MHNDIDYSEYLLITQQYMKEMGDALRKNNYDAALGAGTQALVELRLTLTAIRKTASENT